MRPKNPLVSLVIPAYNESGNLEWHNSKIIEFFTKHSINYELIYVDDGSTDNSLAIIQKLSAKYKAAKYISLSRNFGKEAATSAGIKQSAGDVVVMIDADGQHPIELVNDFLSEWYAGYDVVVGVRKRNKKEGLIKRFGSRLYSIILGSLNGRNTPRGSTDFRLIDRKVANEFNALTEHNRITRGLIDWLGFKRAYVEFRSPARHSGKAAYSFKKLVVLALHSFTSQSTKPLQFTGFLGFIVTVVSACLAIFLIIERYALHDPLHLAVTGSAILALFISFLVGLVLICQWLLALYVESIHNETQNRPLYIVSQKSK
ncbi:MAG TPA: glycosyltransferase family 2 protein [Candidatus Saccharimonadales bacterium]|nr:glycosyltransferase family 2 protein [Candidatus Saccharimonadales bacterium]